ncbi:MAG: molybdopterin-dependent oxidoreductase, partial [Geminicoccaceae bacterium]
MPVSLCHWGAFEAEIEDGRLVAARPWADGGADPEMIGALPEMVYSEHRIDRVYIREGWLKSRHRSDGAMRGREVMVPVGWDEALALVGEEIERVRDIHGHKALFAGSYGWSSAGRFHHARSQIRRFYGALGGFTDQTGNYSWGAAQIILRYVLGDDSAVSRAATSWESIAGNTDKFVAFGGLNPKNWRVTSGGAGLHHMPRHIERACASGMQVVVISPVADDIPDGVDALWIAPRPGSDTAIMLGLCHDMLERGRADVEFLNRYCTGNETFIAYLEGEADGIRKSLNWAAETAGVELAELANLADLIAQGRVMLTASWSLQRAHHGEHTYWALIALAAMLGQIGLPGGGFSFGYGSLNAVGESARKGLVPGLPTLGNQNGMSIPAARIADMLAWPGATIDFDGGQVTYPDIQLIHWAGGNPFHHAQDLFRLERLWAKPETIIVHEPFWTATAKRADIVLPATTSLERNDIGGSSRDPHVFFMPKLIAPMAQARNDFDIFRDLSDRLGVSSFAENLDEQAWLQELWRQTQASAGEQGIAAPDYDALRAMNVWPVPPPEDPEVLLADYRQDPVGHKLATPSGRIEIASDRIMAMNLDAMPGHPAWYPPDEWLG